MIQALEDDERRRFLATMADDVEVFSLDSGAARSRARRMRAHYFRTLRKLDSTARYGHSERLGRSDRS